MPGKHRQNIGRAIAGRQRALDDIRHTKQVSKEAVAAIDEAETGKPDATDPRKQGT